MWCACGFIGAIECEYVFISQVRTLLKDARDRLAKVHSLTTRFAEDEGREGSRTVLLRKALFALFSHAEACLRLGEDGPAAKAAAEVSAGWPP